MSPLKNNVKLIALDMDGTLLNDELEISSQNQQLIAEVQKRGIPVVLSTGRTIMTCRPFADLLNLTSYLVTVNGSEIWHTSGKLIERTTLTLEQIEMLTTLRNKYDTRFWATSINHIYRNEIPEQLGKHDWLKFGFDVENDRIREKIMAALSNSHHFEVTNSSLTNIEVNAAGINKANALKKICKKLDIEMDNVMAMGDSLNDLAMINEAGIGIAMGNAQEAVKQAADWTTLKNIDDGVAAAIHKFVFQKNGTSVLF